DIVVLEQATSTVTILYANVADRVHSPIDFDAFDAFEGGSPVVCGASVRITEGDRNVTAKPEMPFLGSINNGATGAVTRKWFMPSDYRHGGTLDTIGQPSIVLKVGDGPVALRLADMNQDGQLDVCVASYTGESLTYYVADGTDSQEGPRAPPTAHGDQLSPWPADPPFYTRFLPAGAREASFRGYTTSNAGNIPFTPPMRAAA